VVPIMAVMLAGSAHAAPFVIGDYDAAETVELKLDTEFRDKTGEELTAFPKWDITIPIVKHLEMSFGSSYRRLHVHGEGKVHGFGDTDIAAKWNFLDPETNSAGIALTTEPELSIPTGSERKGLGDGHFGITVPLIVQKEFGPWSISGEISYFRLLGGAKEHSVGLASLLQYHVTEKFKIGAEIVTEAPGFTDADDRETEADVGFKWKFKPHWELTGLAGHSLHHDDGSHYDRMKVGIEYHF
jgi:hypothetical protein